MNIVPLLSSLPEPSFYLIQEIIAPLAPAASSDYSTFKRKPKQKRDNKVIK